VTKGTTTDDAGGPESQRPANDESRLKALRDALLEGEESGPPRALDIATFLAERRTESIHPVRTAGFSVHDEDRVAR